MFLNNKKRPAFTLIELLVVIAIIGILSTLAVVALQGARSKARDTKRISDIRQMQTALELYFNDNGYYPALVTSTIASSGIVYMATVPSSPTPADGDCSESDNNYSYTSDGSSYSINTCIGANINSLSKGTINASPSGIVSLGSGSSGNPPGGTGSFNCGDSLIDSRDGQSYPTVQIGTQCWMAKNLNIGTRVNSSANQADNPIIEKYCYDNATSNCDIYGGLYQWDEAMAYTSSAAQGICPAGWHIPSSAEWATLETFLGGTSVAGGKLREAGTTHWTLPNVGATNSSGFSALPAGVRNVSSGGFGGLSNNAFFWSSSGSVSTAVHRYLNYDGAYFSEYSDVKARGFSVRCLKN